MLKRLFIKYRDIISYVFFGGCTTVINIGVYDLLHCILRIENVPANIAAWIISVLFAFITNKIFVFRSNSFDRKLIAKELCSFTGARLATGLIDLAIMYISVDIFHSNASLWKIISNVIVIILNYFASKIFVFRKN